MLLLAGGVNTQSHVRLSQGRKVLPPRTSESPCIPLCLRPVPSSALNSLSSHTAPLRAAPLWGDTASWAPCPALLSLLLSTRQFTPGVAPTPPTPPDEHHRLFPLASDISYHSFLSEAPLTTPPPPRDRWCCRGSACAVWSCFDIQTSF